MIEYLVSLPWWQRMFVIDAYLFMGSGIALITLEALRELGKYIDRFID